MSGVNVERPVTDADRNDDVTIEVTEMRGKPGVGKTGPGVEEIVLVTTADERTETARDKVWRKDVEVERTDTRPDDRTHRRP